MRAASRTVLLGRSAVLSECTSVERSLGNPALSTRYEQYALVKAERPGCLVEIRDEYSIWEEDGQALEPLKTCDNDHH